MRKVLITGVSQGIGAAIAKRLLQEGYHVVGVGRSNNKYLKDERDYTFIQEDLSQAKDLEKRIKTIVSLHEDTDVFIGNAGKGLFGNLEQISTLEIQTIFNLNLFHNIYFSKFLLPSMKMKSHGDFIFIGSEASLQGKKKASIYCASKFALRGFVQSLSDECRFSSIRVALINPGFCRTGFYQNFNFEPKEGASYAIEPSQVANYVWTLLNTSTDVWVSEVNINPRKYAVNFKK